MVLPFQQSQGVSQSSLFNTTGFGASGQSASGIPPLNTALGSVNLFPTSASTASSISTMPFSQQASTLSAAAGGDPRQMIVSMMSQMLNMFMMMIQALTSGGFASGGSALDGSLYPAPVPTPATYPGTDTSTDTTPLYPAPAPPPATGGIYGGATPSPTPVTPAPTPATPTPTPVPTPTPTPGTDAADINIMMIEPLKPDHNGQVLGVFQDAGLGGDVTVNTQELPSEVNVPQNLEEFQQLIDQDYGQTLAMASDQLEELLASNDPSMRVVNMSFGRTAMTTMGLARDAVNANPALRDVVGISADADLNGPEANQALVNFVTTQLGSSPTINAELQRYQQVTSEAADRGIMIMVAGGNDQLLLDNLTSQGLNVDPTWALSNLALSENVISVGAIDDHNTPQNINDDTLTDFGSLGSDAFRPTLTADAVDIQGQNGTSFSTPQVSATVQQMLSINPNLTFEQVKEILTGTSQYALGGMPVLNHDGAIAQAQQLAAA